MAVSIKKVKIKDGHPEIEYFSDHKRGGKSIKAECNAPVHEDFTVALKALDWHVGVLCEQMDPQEEDQAIISKFTCTGFSIGGNDEHEGVTLIGRRQMKNSRILNLVSPFQKWEDENAPYRYADDLKRLVDAVIDEADAYLFDDKYAPDQQMELFGAVGVPAEAQ